MEWQPAVEVGEGLGRGAPPCAHLAHGRLTVHHYSQVQINMPVMQMMFKGHYNNQCQQLGIASMMQRGMPYIQVKLLPYRYIPGI